METTTIYANYGMLGHEREAFWAVVPTEEAYDEVRVALPEGYALCENGLGEALVEEEATGETVPLTMALAKFAKSPYLRFPSGDSWHSVSLNIVEEQGE